MLLKLYQFKMNSITIKNNQSVPVQSIPVLEYDSFHEYNLNLIQDHPERHCVLYFGYNEGDHTKVISCIADDIQHGISISSSVLKRDSVLTSLSAKNLNFEKFEREIRENFGVEFSDHPWNKPVRYSSERKDQSKVIENYPFFKIDS